MLKTLSLIFDARPHMVIMIADRRQETIAQALSDLEKQLGHTIPFDPAAGGPSWGVWDEMNRLIGIG